MSEQTDDPKSEEPIESSDPSSATEPSAVRLPKIIPFRDLCRCGDEVWIEHGGQLYRLRCTKQGKLLLTK
ncbi:MAG: hemin uptake protein HemP [Pirellula sp.]|jgi:hemin uptake protein HemP